MIPIINKRETRINMAVMQVYLRKREEKYRRYL